jgi:outer membrane beta-barrel protein
MKKRTLFLIVLSLVGCLLTQVLFAADWESLGSTEAILKKAKALDPNNKVRVVQKRAVDRDMRLEVSGHYGFINGGDSYVKTQSGGAQLEFHVNPKWSLGVRYDRYFNALTSEGTKIYNQSETAIAAGSQATLPDINFPIDSQLATVSWYPIYGKLNLFDQAVTQFDVYLLAGAGMIQLDSGSRSTLTAFGGGAGLWFSQHIMARLEIRYQGYQDKAYAADPQVNTTAMHLSLGFLL